VRMRNGVRAAIIAMLLVSGCSAASGAALRPPGASGPAGYWSRSRLLNTRPLLGGQRTVPLPGQTPDAHTAVVALRVGALFERNASGEHFCTARAHGWNGRNAR
jgi:hypothetical protein